MMNKIQTKYCSKCGQLINPQDETCGNCGYKTENVCSEQKENKLTKKIIIYALIIIFGLSIVIIIIMLLNIFPFLNARLPQVVKILYSDKTINEVSKARYPENFVWGLGGWLRDADEIWCVSYSYDDWPYGGSDLAVRIGGDWSRYTVYDSMWKMVGCRHEFKQHTKTGERTLTATVASTSWELSILVEELLEVNKNDWWDEIPDDAEVQSCTQAYRYTSKEPVPNSTEVYSEPYVEDTGSGVGEVFQDVTYEVYDECCDYTILQWDVVDTITESGNNHNPLWPSINLDIDQRLGQREESYTIVFHGDGETYSYKTSDVDLFLKMELGSEWTLRINQLGEIQSLNLSN